MKSHRSETLALIGAAMAALLATSAGAQVHPEKPVYKYEKCYGIAKAGKNDCFFSGNSCAGTAAENNLPGAWIYLPKGTCQRITGASLEPPQG